MKYLFIIISYFIPASLFAQQLLTDHRGTDKTFSGLVDSMGSMFQAIFIFIIALSFLVFLWGLARTLLHIGSAEANQKAKDIMLWGGLGLFISITIFGILSLVTETIGL